MREEYIYIYICVYFFTNYVSTSYYYYYSVNVRFRMDTKILFASVEKKGKKDYPHNQGYREIIWRER